MHPALTYLAARSIRNGVALRLHRLRRPRYLVIAIAGLLYFALMIVNRWHTRALVIPAAYEGLAGMAIAGVIALTMSLTWILPGAAALRFTVSDVQFLFPAPLARRELLVYKIVRLMTGALATSAFMTLLVGPVHLIPGMLFYVKFATIAGIIALHEAGVSLYRLNARNAGGVSAGRRARVVAVNGALIAVSAWLLSRFAFAGARQLLLFAPIAAIVIVAQIAWILRSDAAFEEEATTAAEKARAAMERFQRMRPTIVRARSTPFRLAPRGPAETAILWKNWMLLSRTSGRRWMTIGAIVAVIAIAAGFAFADGDPAGAVIGLVLAGAATLMGPVMLRVDLRQDLGNLVLIKTWPVRGAAIVRGEVLAPAIALSATAAAGLLVAALFAPGSMLPSAAGFTGRAGFFCAATTLASALIVAQLVIQNSIAALFPAWVRITPGSVQPGGIEMMGQMMVVMYGGLFVLVLAAIVPAAAAATIYFFTRGVLVSAAIFALVLLVESYAATEIIGQLLDRVDLRDVAVAD